jgi:hypothetical protein
VQDARTMSWAHYGSLHTASLMPGDFELPQLAASLADKWLEICLEQGRADGGLATAVRGFLRHVGEQPHAVGSQAGFGLPDLRRRHLDAWELDLLAAHRAAGSDTNYRKAVYVLALLDRIDADHPGVLHREVTERLESHTRLGHHRNPGLAAYSREEVRRLRGAAHRQVHAHLQDPNATPSAQLLVALHVLLSLATGEPPEVLRSLTVDDVVATTAPEHDPALAGLTAAQRLRWIAERDLATQYAVTYHKNRAHQSYQDVYARRDHSAHQALTTLIRVTSELRDRSGLAALWQQQRPGGRITEPAWNTPALRLQRWTASAGLEVSQPCVFARFRKVVVAGEALAQPRDYFSGRRRHAPRTFFGHYTNSSILRAESGRLLLEGTDRMFDAAIAGPTVVTPEAEELLGEGLPAPGLDLATAAALMGGELDGPHAACRDPQDGPFSPSGQTCPLSMTGTCFNCSNALVTRHHLPAALAIADIADPDRAADVQAWLEHWKPPSSCQHAA